MFGSIGGFEILILLAIGLLVFGPRRLPEMGRWVARGLGELRRAAADVKSAVEAEADLSEVTRAAADLKQAVNAEARRLIGDLESEAAEVRGTSNARPAGSGRPPVGGSRGDAAAGTVPRGDPGGVQDGPGARDEAAAGESAERTSEPRREPGGPKGS